MYQDDDSAPSTAPVGSYPKGATPDGVLDLAGNVWEWTESAYCPYDKPTVVTAAASCAAAAGTRRSRATCAPRGDSRALRPRAGAASVFDARRARSLYGTALALWLVGVARRDGGATRAGAIVTVPDAV